MLNLEVVLDGKKIAVETPEQWNDVDSLLRAYWRLTGVAQNAPVSETEKATPSTLNQATVDYQQEPIEATAGSVATMRRSWTERAWLKLNRPATGEDLYKVAIGLGYRSNAMNPMDAFKRALRDNPAFIQAGLDDTRATLWVLKDGTDNKVEDEQPLLPEKSQAQRVNDGNNSNLIPVLGLQTADFAERALRRVGHGLPLGQLVQEMLADNWINTSATPELRENSVQVALYRNKDRFIRRNGFWLLTDWPIEETQSENPSENPSLSGFEGLTEKELDEKEAAVLMARRAAH